MRRIVMFNRVTVDGYFAGADGNLNWVVPDHELDRWAAEAIQRTETDLILFGRRTYELFEAFWSRALEDTPKSPNTHDAAHRSPEMRAMAIMLNQTPKVVFSRTLENATWKNSRLVRALDPHQIAAMKEQPGKDVIVFGSGSIVSQLTERALIDEYQLVVSPIILGGGRSLIADLPKSLKLDLLEAKVFRSGNVMLRYAPHQEAV